MTDERLTAAAPMPIAGARMAMTAASVVLFAVVVGVLAVLER